MEMVIFTGPLYQTETSKLCLEESSTRQVFPFDSRPLNILKLIVVSFMFSSGTQSYS